MTMRILLLYRELILLLSFENFEKGTIARYAALVVLHGEPSQMSIIAGSDCEILRISSL